MTHSRPSWMSGDSARRSAMRTERRDRAALQYEQLSAADAPFDVLRRSEECLEPQPDVMQCLQFSVRQDAATFHIGDERVDDARGVARDDVMIGGHLARHNGVAQA